MDLLWVIALSLFDNYQLTHGSDPSTQVEGPAASLPIILCHGRVILAVDDVVWFRYGEKLGHYIIPEDMDAVSSWLTSKLELEGES
ncbi:hypothetical protein L1887_03162 [Cichorium endivia]|nr:hypothetical protein L1887_03162 [Cichorium endivia]